MEHAAMTGAAKPTLKATRLFLVRHGATQLTAEDRFSGAVGVDLSDEGRQQVRMLAGRLAGQNVLVVSHKATLRLLLSSLLGFDARGYRDRLDQSPACLNVVDFKDPVRARLMLFNDISHYQDTPRRAGAGLSKWWDVPKA